MELTEPVTGRFDLVRAVRESFPKQMTFELRSELVLEKISEKNEEDNSWHWEQHVPRPCREKELDTKQGLKEGL